MLHYKYLIVGGGMTAAAAVAGIREVDRQGTIGLIGAESLGVPNDARPDRDLDRCHLGAK